MKPNTGNTLHYRSKCSIVQLTDSCGPIGAGWRHNVCSHNHLDSCQIFSLAPVESALGGFFQDAAQFNLHCCCALLSNARPSSVPINEDGRIIVVEKKWFVHKV